MRSSIIPETVGNRIATVAAEIAAQLPEGQKPDLVILPVGGGGLAAGITRYFEDDLDDSAFLFAEPAGAPSLAESLKAGKRLKLPKVDNFVDGASVAEIGAVNFDLLKHFNAGQVITPPENAICVTISEILTTEGIVLEPAGALALTALIAFSRGIGRVSGIGLLVLYSCYVVWLLAG